MNLDPFNVFAEQLHDGHHHKMHIVTDCDFLKIDEEALRFSDQVFVDGEAYLANETLILHLKISATAIIPCSICNDSVQVPIHISDLYLTEDLENIKNGIFNCAEAVREAILLDTPQFAECEGGCPLRKEIDHYLKKPKEKNEEDRYHPFADL